MLTRADCPAPGSEEQEAMQEEDYCGLVSSINYLAMTMRLPRNPGMQCQIAAKHVPRCLQSAYRVSRKKRATKLVVKILRLQPFASTDFSHSYNAVKLRLQRFQWI